MLTVIPMVMGSTPSPEVWGHYLCWQPSRAFPEAVPPSTLECLVLMWLRAMWGLQALPQIGQEVEEVGWWSVRWFTPPVDPVLATLRFRCKVLNTIPNIPSPCEWSRARDSQESVRILHCIFSQRLWKHLWIFSFVRLLLSSYVRVWNRVSVLGVGCWECEWQLAHHCYLRVTQASVLEMLAWERTPLLSAFPSSEFGKVCKDSVGRIFPVPWTVCCW